MSPCSQSEQLRHRAAFASPRLLDLALASLGCLAAIAAFGFETGALVGGWWCLTLVIVKSDLEDLIIPNWASAGIAILGLVHVAFGAFAISSHWQDVANAIIAAIERAGLTFLGVAAFAFVFKLIIGREALGFGDVKLSGALAVWLSAYGLFVSIELACFAALSLVGLAYLRNRQTALGRVIPFGAFFAPAAWLLYLGRVIGVGWGS